MFGLAPQTPYVQSKDQHSGTKGWEGDALSPQDTCSLAASLMHTERGMYGGDADERGSEVPSLSFFFFLMVTFSKWIELIWRVLGEDGVTAKNIERVL